MRYLICLEGEYNKEVDGGIEKNNYLKAKAEERKQFGYKNVDKWLNEMLEYGFSQVYTHYPEIVIILNEE